MSLAGLCENISKRTMHFWVREVVKKSKWKFKMAFAMKGGSRGGLECHIPILKNDFFKTIYNHSLTVKMCFPHSLGFKLYTYSSCGDHEYG